MGINNDAILVRNWIRI